MKQSKILFKDEEHQKRFKLLITLDSESTSKISLIFPGRLILSPLAKHKVLVSSKAVLRFSTQVASTGPSKIIQRHSCSISSLLKQRKNAENTNLYFHANNTPTTYFINAKHPEF